MTAKLKPVALLSSAVLLFGCGGGGAGGGFDTAAYQQAVDAALAKEAEARVLAVDRPCDTILQCGVVSFTDPKDQCAIPVYQPYSLVTVTAAAAKVASDQQLALAAHARELSPQPLVACPAYASLPPVLACVTTRCITGSGTPL
ncbi:MAG: hypothetical protein WCJ76_02940 [Comamonadaceae bacterium]